MLGWFLTGFDVALFIALAIVIFNKRIMEAVKVIVAWGCLTLMGISNILTYIFVSQFPVNLVIGIMLIVEVVVQACRILYEDEVKNEG